MNRFFFVINAPLTFEISLKDLEMFWWVCGNLFVILIEIFLVKYLDDYWGEVGK